MLCIYYKIPPTNIILSNWYFYKSKNETIQFFVEWLFLNAGMLGKNIAYNVGN